MVLRKLLDRLEDADTGTIPVSELHVPIPEERIQQPEKAAGVLGGAIVDDFPLLAEVHVLADNPVELLLNNSWRPALAVTGQDGMPSVPQAGNVLLPQLTYKLSLRLPPTLQADKAHGSRQARSRDSATVWGTRHRNRQWYEWLECPTPGTVAG